MFVRWVPRRVLAGAVAATVALVGCRWTPPDETVTRALFCDECTASEFDSVVAHGPRSIPMLLSALTLPADSVLNGVRATALDEVARAQHGSPAVAFDTLKAVDAAVETFITSYQRRAALLLYRIGTPDAKRALGIALMALPPQSPGSLRPGARRLADSLWREIP